MGNLSFVSQSHHVCCMKSTIWLTCISDLGFQVCLLLIELPKTQQVKQDKDIAKYHQ